LGSAPQAKTPFYLPTRWSGRDLGAVIGGLEDNGAIRDAEVVEFFKQLLNHAVEGRTDSLRTHHEPVMGDSGFT
jgi:hypothetical protein